MNVVQSLFDRRRHQWIFLHFQKFRKHKLQIQVSVNSSEVTEACGRDPSYVPIRVVEEAKAKSLNPSPVRVVVGRAEKGVYDCFLIPALNHFF